MRQSLERAGLQPMSEKERERAALTLPASVFSTSSRRARTREREPAREPPEAPYREKSPPKERVRGRWASGDEAWLATWLGGGPGSWDRDDVDLEVFFDDTTSGEEVDEAQRQSRKSRKREQRRRMREELQAQMRQPGSNIQQGGQTQRQRRPSEFRGPAYRVPIGGGRPMEINDPDALGLPPRVPHHRVRYDMKEFSDKIEIIAELAGFRKEHVKLELQGDVLIITASHGQLPAMSTGSEQEVGKGREGAVQVKKEIPHGDATRHIQLPCEVDPNNIRAQLDEGLLTVTLSKKAPRKEQSMNIPVS